MSYTAGRTLRVLLIEDCRVAQAEVARIFTKDSVQVDLTVVDTLLKGTEYAQDENVTYDLAILDLHLPDSPIDVGGNSGLATFRRWMRCCPHIPVVVFTSSSDDTTAMKCIAEGAQDYVFKNEARFLPRVCKYAIERWCAQHEVKKHRDLLQSILDNTSELVIRFKEDMTVIFLNKKMQEVIDYHVRDFDKSCAVDFVRGIPGVASIVSNLTPAKPHSGVVEMRLCGRYVAWTFSAVYDIFGHLVEYQAIGRDVTYKLMSAHAMADAIMSKLADMKHDLDAELFKVQQHMDLAAAAVSRLQEEVPSGEHAG